jgi:hypothetical protein
MQPTTHPEEDNMSTATLSLDPFVPELPAATRASGALRSLMQMWEQEHVQDEAESEADLMVMLSGMVGSYATSLDEQ